MTQLSPEQQKALEEQKAQCPFCKIIKGEIPARKVFEDDIVCAVMDINPASAGHILVMPKEHYPILPLVPPDVFRKLFLSVKDLSSALKKAMISNSTNIFIANGAAAGQQSAHFLIHVFPRDEKDNLYQSSLPENNVNVEEEKKAYATLANNLPLMMKNHFQRVPTPALNKGTQAPGIPKAQIAYSEEELISIIESNPPIKEMVLNSPD